MNCHFRRTGAAALALVVCLAITPVAFAERRDQGVDVREKINRIIKKIQKLVGGGVTVLDDFPAPPKP